MKKRFLVAAAAGLIVAVPAVRSSRLVDARLDDALAKLRNSHKSSSTDAGVASVQARAGQSGLTAEQARVLETELLAVGALGSTDEQTLATIY